MATKDIRTSALGSDVSCDVCGRTLLRGERAHPFIDRGEHRTVCELCVARAQQEGWLREGSIPAYAASDLRSERRRSLLGWFRRRREAPPTLDPDPEPAPDYSPPPPPPERPRSRPRGTRHVRAIPTSSEHRIAFAVEAFNKSEHTRTVAGVARSLGLPSVSVRPVAEHPSVVNIVVAWELCWYRYEFDLADEDGGVRLGAQGQELEELSAPEREPNAVCDERGRIGPSA